MNSTDACSDICDGTMQIPHFVGERGSGKMNGRKWLKKRGFFFFLSLILCAGTVVSSFAAVEFNKDVHVDENGNLKQADEYYLAGDVELDQTLSINSKKCLLN